MKEYDQRLLKDKAVNEDDQLENLDDDIDYYVTFVAVMWLYMIFGFIAAISCILLVVIYF